MDGLPALAIAFAPGVTITKWTRIWADRHPESPLEILPTDQTQQVSVVMDGTAQLSFVRLPIESAGLHVVPLYSEKPVAVAGKDHFIAAAETITLADLAGEKLQDAGTRHRDRGPFDLVAAGVGVLIVPQSLARLQSRKDVVVRPVTDAPETQIALVWSAAQDASEGAAAQAELIEEFIGVVRGRTARSSRAGSPAESAAPKVSPSKPTPKRTTKPGGAAQRSGAEHAANRKRAASRKKFRGR